jgi:rhamnose utilization protein RhaD (predicted bifunctional aldolase and dehydrogenase)
MRMLRAHIASQQRELNALRELSARLGGNPLLVQASTGNTSVKIGNTLWIKASGKWFTDAGADDFLVSVNLSKARQCLKENTPIPETEAALPGKRASVETAMHAVLPHKVVVHVHSVNTIAWAVRQDGPERLEQRLSALRWKWIPYTPSGHDLAKAIEGAASSCSAANVFVLANHGLVVCGESCHSAEQLLGEVEARLAIHPRPIPAPSTTLPARTTSEPDWTLPKNTQVHALACDQLSRRILSQGVLYPCQVMFLPDLVPCISHEYRQLSILLIDGEGVLCSKFITPAQEQVLRGLAEVVQRIDGLAKIRYLTTSEVLDVLNGPSYYGASVEQLPSQRVWQSP